MGGLGGIGLRERKIRVTLKANHFRSAIHARDIHISFELDRAVEPHRPTLGSPAYADSGGISLRVFKAGFVIGGSAGSGTLFFHGRRYPLDIGGLSYGFTFGASETRFRGEVRNIRRASDVSGVYAAGNVGAAARAGGQAIVLTNQNGAELMLNGNSVGAIVSADLNGLVITVR